MNDDKQPTGNPWMKSLFIWVGILAVLAVFVSVFDGKGSTAAPANTLAYSEFISKVDEGSVSDVKIAGEIVSGKLSNGEVFRIYKPNDPQLIELERTGDFARGYDERVRGLASHFVWTNRSKESLTLDVKNPAAATVLERLILEKVTVEDVVTGDLPDRVRDLVADPRAWV